MPQSFRLALLATLVLGGWAPAVGQPSGEQELLRFVQAAHLASRELIRTSYCRVKLEVKVRTGRPPTNATQSCVGEYWHAADASRLKVMENGETHEYVWKDSVREGLVRKERNGTEAVGATKGSFSNRYLHRGDAWIRGLLVVNVPGTVDYSLFEGLVAQAEKVTKVERRLIGGAEMIAVCLAFGPSADRLSRWEVETHFDPAVNYLIRRVIHRQSGVEKGIERTEEVVRFKACEAGVFFPEQIVGRFGDGQGSNSVLSEIRVNQLLPPDVFRLRYPNGVYMNDTIRGVYYRIDPSGKQISPASALGRASPPPTSVRGGEMGETRDEPKSPSRWILPVAIGMLLVGLFLSIRRRR